MKMLVIKAQIDHTTYSTYGNIKKKPKPFITVIMITRKNEPTPTTYRTTTQENEQLLNFIYFQCN
jgi:hypothetical protein